jgi:hypothetical protein
MLPGDKKPAISCAISWMSDFAGFFDRCSTSYHVKMGAYQRRQEQALSEQPQPVLLITPLLADT